MGKVIARQLPKPVLLVSSPDAEKWPEERYIRHTWYYCQVRHNLGHGHNAALLCWRYAGHPDDCLVVWNGEFWDVSPNGCEDHYPRPSSKGPDGIKWA